MSPVLVALIVGSGLALVIIGLLLRGHERDDDLASILDLPFGERDVPVEAVTERSLPYIAGAARYADGVIGRVDHEGALASALAAAAIPLRVGEYVVLTAIGAVVAAAVATIATSSFVFGIAGVLAIGYVAAVAPRVAANRRRRAIESQLPDALATIGASLEAGHTFLRAIQMYAEEGAAPLADELSRVVRETNLGDPLLDSLDRLAGRLRIGDLDWVVQAIRIQQTTGGRLADVLRTLAEFMRAREEVRREVKVLTAEGRVSAMVLGAMPPLLFVLFQVLNPGYGDPLLRGWGLVVLAAAAASTAVGVGIIVRMVKIEV
jgi:tight adherence protein B